MKFKPYLLYGFGIRPWTTYRIEDGVAYTDTWPFGEASIPLKHAKFASLNSLLPYGTIEISFGSEKLVWTYIPNTSSVMAALKAARKEAMETIAPPGQATPTRQEQYDDSVNSVSDSQQSEEVFLADGHTGTIKRLTFSPDGNLLASGSAYDIKIWNVQSGLLLRTINVRSYGIKSNSFHINGSKLAVDGRYWDVATGKLLGTFKYYKNLQSTSFNHDLSKVASGSFHGWIKLWNNNIFSGRFKLSWLSYHTYCSVHSLAFSHDGSKLASATDFGIKLWGVTRFRLKFLQSIKYSYSPVDFIAINHNGSKIAYVYGKGKTTIQLWDISVNQLFSLIEQEDKEGTSRCTIPPYEIDIAFNHEGSKLASSGFYGKPKLWDTSQYSDKLSPSFDSASFCTSVAFNHNGNLLATGYKEGTIKLWNVSTGEELHTLFLGNPRMPIVSLALSKTCGKLAFGGDYGKTIRLLDVVTGQVLNKAEPDYKVEDYFLPYLPNYNGYGKSAYANGIQANITGWDIDTKIDLFNTADNQLLYPALKVAPPLTIEFREHIDLVVFNQDGSRLAVGVSRFGRGNIPHGTIELLDVKEGQWLRTFGCLPPFYVRLFQGNHGREITSIAFTPDGNKLASGCDFRVIIVWDVATGDRLHVLKPYDSTSPEAHPEGHRGQINTLAFSQDGCKLASGSDDHTIKLWNVATGKILQTLKGHLDSVTSVVFAASGNKLFSSSKDGTVRCWDVHNGKELVQLINYADGEWLALTPEGYYNASANAEKYLNVRINGLEVTDIKAYKKYYRPDIIAERLSC